MLDYLQLLNIYQTCLKLQRKYAKTQKQLLTGFYQIFLEELEPEHIPFTGAELASLVELIDKGTISSAIGKKVLEEMFVEDATTRKPEEIIKAKGWIQISDEGAIKEVVMQVLEANPQSIADYKAGKDRALGFLVGQAMKTTKGKANPQMLNKMFIEEMNK